VRQIQNGPFEGLMGQVTRYQVDVTARTEKGSDAHLRREMQTVTIPIFQFGTFSDMELGFHSAATFDFGGRVHANGNLYLKANATLWLRDKVTTAGEIIRAQLMNGNTAGYTSPVNVLRARPLPRPAGERGEPGRRRPSAQKRADLDQPVDRDLQRQHPELPDGRQAPRPAADHGRRHAHRPDSPPGRVQRGHREPTLFDSRYFSMASLRILLSDTAADLTNLPTVTPVAQCR
jgi:hypothetical protein